MPLLIDGIVVEIALDVDDGRALVAAAAGQVAQRTDQVGEVAGGGALGHHASYQGLLGVLGPDLLGYGLLQRLAGQVGKFLVRQVLQLQLVGRAHQAGGVAGGDHRVGQLPDLAGRVFERAVAVDHGLDALAGGLAHGLADGLRHGLGVPGKQLHTVLVGLVAAQQAVLGVIAAAVHRGGQQIVQPQHHLRAGGGEQTLAALAGVDVAADDGVGVVQHRLHPVGEHDLCLRAGLLDDGLVVVHIVHAGEGMDHRAEGLAELGQAQHVVPGVDARLVQLIQRHQMVAHLIGGIAQHQHHLLHAQSDAPQQQGEAVAAQNGERDAHGLAAGLGLHVGGDLLAGGVVALAAGHHGLGDGHHVAVAGGDVVLPQGVQNSVHRGLDDVIALAEDGCANAPDNSA